jgi:hypothetical protein
LRLLLSHCESGADQQRGTDQNEVPHGRFLRFRRPGDEHMLQWQHRSGCWVPLLTRSTPAIAAARRLPRRAPVDVRCLTRTWVGYPTGRGRLTTLLQARFRQPCVGYSPSRCGQTSQWVQ